MDIVRQSSRPFSLLRGRLRVLCFEFTLGSPSETKGVSRWRDSGKVIDSRWLAQISGVRDGQWSRSEQALLSITSSRLPEGRELPWPVFVNFPRRRDTSIWITFTFECGAGHFPDARRSGTSNISVSAAALLAGNAERIVLKTPSEPHTG